MTSKSAIYIGDVEHRRLAPKKNIFSYSVCYYFLELEEIPKIFKFPFLFSYNFPGLLSFWRKDYLGSKEKDLKAAVKEEIFKATQQTFEGQIKLLTNISYFGFCMNPVSFYYCYDSEGKNLKYIVSEITNTPWGERHPQVFSFDQEKDKKVYEFPKNFHVSPFMPMTIDYTWVFHTPNEKLFVYMQNRNKGEKELIFDSTLKLVRKDLNASNVALSFFSFPFVTLKTMVAIYYQAAKLYFKNVPFYTHPSKELNR